MRRERKVTTYRVEAVSRPDPGPSWYVPSDEGDHSRFLGDDGLPSLRLIPYTDHLGGRGFRLCEDRTGLLVGPSDRRLPRAGLIVVNVKGEYYYKESIARGDFRPGQPVTLIPEPDNPHDDRAVMVCDAWGNKCGYMNKQKARMYLKRIREGAELEGTVLMYRLDDDGRSAVQILVAEPAIIAHLHTPRPAGAPTPAHLRSST